MRRTLAVAAACGAAAALAVAASLPPPRIALTEGDAALSGALHVHTSRSDGRGSPDEVAAAAARAGLDFIVFTDHGDGTRAPDAPVYRSGVLCLDGVEISTSGGHILVIGMPPAPYPLAGTPRAVLEDIQRLGGVAIVAHPDSPRADLSWQAWDLPVDGFEILNLDTSWRRPLYRPAWQPAFRFLRSLVAYPFRPEEAIAGLLTISPEGAAGALAATEHGHATLVGGVDAHARLGWHVEPGEADYSLPFPGYETVFRTMAIRARLDRPLTANAAVDAATVIRAIREGNLYTVVTGLAGPSAFEFTAANGHGTAGEGGHLLPDGPVTLRVRSNAPEGFSTLIFEGREAVAEGEGRDVSVTVQEPTGVYRAEVRAPGADGPVWIASNPIRVRVPAAAEAAPLRTPERRRPLFDGSTTAGWRVETSDTSTARLTQTPGVGLAPLVFDYTLGANAGTAQFAALVVETPSGVAGYDRLTIQARATRPMRLAVMARAAVTPSTDEAWSRSVYLDESLTEITVFFDDMAAVGTARTARPPRGDVHSLLLLVDLTNARRGSAGAVTVLQAALEG